MLHGLRCQFLWIWAVRVTSRLAVLHQENQDHQVNNWNEPKQDEPPAFACVVQSSHGNSKSRQEGAQRIDEVESPIGQSAHGKAQEIVQPDHDRNSDQVEQHEIPVFASAGAAVEVYVVF